MKDKMKAKMEMLKKLKEVMRKDDFGEYADGMKGKLKKVTVAAPDEEGLQKGLSLAEKILAKKRESSDEEEMPSMKKKSDSSDEEMMEEDEEYEHDEEDAECPCKMCEMAKEE